MNPLHLIEKYFPDRQPRLIVMEHSQLVAAKAVSIARSLDEPTDIIFIEQAAMLHDIGICRTSAPGIGCHGTDHYLCHGVHGREILESEGLHRHAMVCERHIGVGLTIDDITSQKLPLPIRDMSPTCLEEEIISFADLFYSKRPDSLSTENSVEAIRSTLARYGSRNVKIFESWMERFLKTGELA